MKIAIASGKGGTGKTTVALGLAMALKDQVTYLDCDVEEPNAFLFLKPKQFTVKEIHLTIPVVKQKECQHCGLCKDICQFNAIIALPHKTIIFDELCHSCIACITLCPNQALAKGKKFIGTLTEGYANKVNIIQGKLDIGYPMSPPLIKQLKKYKTNTQISIIDCPPGTSCPFAASVDGVDHVILVTEPTPFGLHDLKLSVESLRKLRLPFGIILNKSSSQSNQLIYDYCKNEEIPLYLEIPESINFAKANSKGDLILKTFPELENDFIELIKQIKKESTS